MNKISTAKILMFLLTVVLMGSASIIVEAKTKAPDLETAATDYYILKEGSSGKPGTVSAKLQNKISVIEIPEEVTIGGKSYTVTKITGLCYPDTPDTSLKQDSYRCIKNKKTTSILLPKTVTYIEKGSFTNFTKLKTIEISSDNPKFKVKDGAVLSKNGKVLYGTITLKGTCHIPDGVEQIASRAFAYSAIKKVVFPDSCKKIGARAFYKCKQLSKAKNLNENIKQGNGAFYGTKLMKCITLP